MKAVVFHDIGDIRLEDVEAPELEEASDAIVRITASAICGTDLHMIRGTLPGMKPGTILGHEGIGLVEELGANVRNLLPGDRVVIASSIACGTCVYCRASYFSQCDRANPNGSTAGTAFFGGPADSGPFNGMQAECVRVPFANVGAIKLPDEISDDDAILLADIFPTGYMGAELAEITPGDTVAVFGCGPVGQFAIAAAKLMDAGRIFAIDYEPSRLDMAQAQGAETIDFESENPVEALRDLTGGIGPDRAIDAVGVDAVMPHRGPGAPSRQERRQFEAERDQVAPAARTKGKDWASGDAPSQVLSWAVQSLAKAGTLAIIGVYPSSARTFPIGDAMNKNLTVKMGNCDHRKYIPRLIQLVRTGAVTPSNVLTAREPLMSALEAYQAFDKRQPGWIKVELVPQLSPAHG